MRGQVSTRKRPRGAAGVAAAGAPAAAMAGSFTAARLARGDGAWSRVAEEGRRRGAQAAAAAADAGWGGAGLRMLGIGFHPPELSVLVHGTVQAIMLGAFAALIPKITAERIREKEAGLELDEAYEAGLLDDDFYDDVDEFGYPRGYVCATCDNTNEVECPRCEGKGFFVSASAMPKKCGYCSGLGTVPCPDCSERRERLRREAEARMPPRGLPPARSDDFPFTR
eukprot:g13204.t1